MQGVSTHAAGGNSRLILFVSLPSTSICKTSHLSDPQAHIFDVISVCEAQTVHVVSLFDVVDWSDWKRSVGEPHQHDRSDRSTIQHLFHGAQNLSEQH